EVENKSRGYFTLREQRADKSGMPDGTRHGNHNLKILFCDGHANGVKVMDLDNPYRTPAVDSWSTSNRPLCWEGK
ncbi:MAG: hypothetical protein PHY82_01230, partial [Lentisphaeria bacterium]|nr:hypothetical protein [Lentisphaeria bacterium]